MKTKGHEMTESQIGRWYMVTKDGAATLCVDEQDARDEAARADQEWPRNAPHRAVQLVEASELANALGTRKVLWSLLGECLPVIDALMQIPGDDDTDAWMNCLAGRINDARAAVQAEELPASEGSN